MNRTILRVAVAAVAAGCTTVSPPSPGTNTITTELRDAGGRAIGTATFTEVADGVRILLEVRGLPSGPKGVHLHEIGLCEPPTFASAGAHVNPDGKKHGLLNPDGPHAGDLPNITIASDGAGRLESMNTAVRLASGPRSLLDAGGSAVIVHARPDDFATDPDGGSGAPLACGVVAGRR